MLAALSCLGCGQGITASTEDQLQGVTVTDELRVHVIRPEFTRNAAKTVVFYGKFQPVEESRLRFARPGIVSNVLKTVGDSVAEGELIAELEQKTLVDQTSEAESKLKAAQDSIKAMPASDNAKQMAEIQQLEGQVAKLRAQLAIGKLTADIAGTIVKSNLKLGATAVPGRHYLIVANKEAPVVVLNLDSESAAQLTDQQSIWVGHNKRPLQTTIQSREAIVTEAGAEQVTLEFLKPLESSSWSYDTVVEVRYRTFEAESGYWLPMTALNRSANGDWSVLVAEPVEGKASVAVLRQQSCEIVRQRNDQVLVAKAFPSGLGTGLVTAATLENAAVVLDGSHRVVAGQTVVPIELLADDSGTFRPNDDR